MRWAADAGRLSDGSTLAGRSQVPVSGGTNGPGVRDPTGLRNQRIAAI